MEIVVIIVSMIPIFELRGGIPVAFILKLAWWKAFIFAIIGNLIPIPLILLLLDPISKYIRKAKFMDRFFEWLFTRSRKKTESDIMKYGLFFGLMIFVAIPLPATGAWTGALAAFVLGMKFRYAMPSIALGVLIAGVVVSIVTYGTATVIRML